MSFVALIRVYKDNWPAIMLLVTIFGALGLEIGVFVYTLILELDLFKKDVQAKLNSLKLRLKSLKIARDSLKEKYYNRDINEDTYEEINEEYQKDILALKSEIKEVEKLKSNSAFRKFLSNFNRRFKDKEEFKSVETENKENETRESKRDSVEDR